MFGLAKGKIQKNTQRIFLQEAKIVPPSVGFQLRRLPAGEPKPANFKNQRLSKVITH